MREIKKIGTFVKGFIILNVIWYIFSIVMNSRIVPKPQDIYRYMPTLFKNGFYIHITASLYRVVIGLLISLVIGIIIGLLMGYSKKVNKLFYHVTIPAILPEILTNIRLSIGTSFSILFFVEAYGTNKGLGYFIQDAWSRINYIEMYSGIVMLSFLGLILFILIDFFEGIVCKWKM